MKEKADRPRTGKQFARCVVELDTGEREINHTVEPVHKLGQKDVASWARKFFLAVRDKIQRSFAGRETHAHDS